MSGGVTAHVMVRNEGRWLWFAIMPVIEHVDHAIVCDTGSIDSTRRCIEWFQNHPKYRGKITSRFLDDVPPSELSNIRQYMINETNTEWFMILDGDEIWFERSIQNFVHTANETTLNMIAVPFINVVGDVFSRQLDDREHYHVAGRTGSITVKGFRRSIDGLHCTGEYGVEGYFDANHLPVQARSDEIAVIDKPFLHTSNTARSSTITGDLLIPYRRKKIAAPVDYRVAPDRENFPEVFYVDRPAFVPDPFRRPLMHHVMRFIWSMLRGARRKAFFRA
jgi:hypothetical protein